MWLGLDLGTSSVKALVIGDDGERVAEASMPLEISRPHAGWSEQDPEAWWRAARQAVLAIPASVRASVRGVGLSGQMHGAVLLDDADRVLRPAILWNDSRATAECGELEAIEPRSREITGNQAMPGFTAPKLLWVARHEPDVFARVATVLLPKDYLRLRLTGECVSEPSDAAGTLWLDTAARSWSSAMLAATGLDERHMPRLVEGDAVSGTVGRDVAAELGIPAVPVAGGGGDNAAGAVGIGALEPGQGFVSLGTSGVVFVVSDGFQPSPANALHAFCHAVPDRWHQMAVVLSAAAAIDWAARVSGFVDTPSAVSAAAARDPAVAPPVFLPYLSGERTPHNDPFARGVFFGLDHRHDGAALVQAALEGVAFALADGVDALRATGTEVGELALIGGGGVSDHWASLVATACDVRLLRRLDAAAGPALGAAKLACAAVTGSLRMSASWPARRTAPDATLAAQLAGRRHTYRSLYRDLRARFRDSPC